MEKRSEKLETRLRITEIFHSLQGESRTVGIPTSFIRLTGCPLRCGYCDTEYAFSGGNWMELSEILASIKSHNTHFVTVTGGEPLAQKSCLVLLKNLCDSGYQVSLETSGALDVCQVDPRVSRVMDIKTPGSSEESKNLWSNIDCLTKQDQIKFVLCDRQDYEWAIAIMHQYELTDKCEVLFSPSHRILPISDLADWVLEDRLPVRVQIQLHKYIWGEQPGK